LPAAAKIAGHALLAGVFFFFLQYFLLSQTVETSVIWAIAAAAGAALLAWLQHRRSGGQ
jgi:hypothetical protein